MQVQKPVTMNQAEFQAFREIAIDHQDRGVEHHHIEATLTSKGAHPEAIKEILREIKTMELIRRKKRGFKLVLAGSLFLVFGFLITLALFHTSVSISYSMYGLTTLGVVLLLWGMVDIMGW